MRRRDSKTGRQWVLLCTALLVTFVGACSSSSAPTPATVPGPSSAIASLTTKNDVEALLLDSFVIAPGDTHYFVDDGWSSARSPFSPYETYWQLRWRSGRLPEGMDEARIQPWVRVAAVAGLGSSSMQDIAQIGLATGIARQLGTDLDSNAVTTKLETLRDGYRYAPDPGSAGAWGSTSVAAQVIRDVGRPVPAETMRQAKLELARMPDIISPQEVVNTALPLLELFSLGRTPSDSPADALRVSSAALHSLDAVPPSALDITWLGARYQLSSVRTGLGQPPLRLPAETCARLVTPKGLVTLPNQTGADIQGIFYARELGCPGVVSELSRPYTRAGWVLGSAIDPYDTLGATSVALDIADLLHDTNGFANRLGASVRQLWQPLLADKSLAPNARVVTAARLSHVVAAAGLDGPPSEPVSKPSTQGDYGLLDMVAAMTMGDAEEERVAQAVLERHGRGGGQESIDAAAELILAGARLNDTAASAKGAAIAGRLRIDDSVYTAVRCDAGAPSCPAPEPSIAASAIGSWIDRSQSNPRQRWESRGMCRGYLCSDNSQDGASLSEIYIAIACEQPACGRKFPLVL